jgi:uncharacterized membrane protein YfcA
LLADTSTFIKHHPIKIALLLVWICLLFVSGQIQYLAEYGAFIFLGVVGAIFANSTGAGGGVVFVPFFNQLSLSNETIVATSFAIQCCGMTAGAISWYRHYGSIKRFALTSENKVSEEEMSENEASYSLFIEWQALPKALILCVPFSILGILTAQFLLSDYTSAVQTGLHFYFGLFSIILAFAIYGSIPFMKRQANRARVEPIDRIMLALICFIGGIVTAWLSVGVGELVAVYLILRGFNISFAIALAVILSAFSVHGAIYYHLFVSQAVYWQIVIFAGAGAIMGGLIAKHVVLFFSPIKLKVFFGTWVLIMGAAGLPIWA